MSDNKNMAKNRIRNRADVVFSFKISKDDKDRITEEIERIKNAFNKQLEFDDYKIKMNEIIVIALKKGLKVISLEDMPSRRKRKLPF